ncbi:MAG: hypothetical protein AAB710_00050, partial [Patescibacteria group bacterium]
VAVSVPELFIGLTAAFQGIPELSLGNIVGANIIHFTLALALATIVLGELKFESSNVRTSADFTIFFALFPFLLMIDGALSRVDGVILISSFFIYIIWVFSKRERFSQFYKPLAMDGYHALSHLEKFRQAMRAIGMFSVGMGVLLLSAQGIVSSATYFANIFHVPLVAVGVFVVGLGTALPETYFAVSAARRGNAWMVVGNLLGATVFTASFVLGLVAFLEPIVITNFAPFVIARAFLIMSAIAILLFSRSDEKITSREAFVLLMMYALFAAAQVLAW